MAYTKEELRKEFWLLTKGILQDGNVDTEEASVVRKWLVEHQTGDEFALTIGKLDKFLNDGYIDRFESKTLVDSVGTVLRTLRTA